MAAILDPQNWIISMIRVEQKGTHELVSVWARGAVAGALIVRNGDGGRIANRLLDNREDAACNVSCVEGFTNFTPTEEDR